MKDEITIDNLDLMCFWCRDEYCNKTLGEILPAYKKHLKQKKEQKKCVK